MAEYCRLGIRYSIAPTKLEDSSHTAVRNIDFFGHFEQTTVTKVDGPELCASPPSEHAYSRGDLRYIDLYGMLSDNTDRDIPMASASCLSKPGGQVVSLADER